MAKSFCKGCKHWLWDKENTFHYCDRLGDFSIRYRKKMCNGEFYENSINNIKQRI